MSYIIFFLEHMKIYLPLVLLLHSPSVPDKNKLLIKKGSKKRISSSYKSTKKFDNYNNFKNYIYMTYSKVR